MCGIIGIVTSNPSSNPSPSSSPSSSDNQTTQTQSREQTQLINGDHNPNILCQLLNALQKLTYRGYDSAGVALHGYCSTDPVNIVGNVPTVIKATGKIINLFKAIDTDTRKSLLTPAQQDDPIAASQSTKSTPVIGIGHTRWATHGDPNNPKNSHPHQSTSRYRTPIQSPSPLMSDEDLNPGLFTLVHNGIIENYLDCYNDFLLPLPYPLQSQTDTEIIVGLMEVFATTMFPEHYHNLTSDQVVQIIATVSSVLRGSFALCVIYAPHQSTLYATKRHSPLCVGTYKEASRCYSQTCVASDSSTIDLCQDLHYLTDNDIIAATHDQYQVYRPDTLNLGAGHQVQSSSSSSSSPSPSSMITLFPIKLPNLVNVKRLTSEQTTIVPNQYHIIINDEQPSPSTLLSPTSPTSGLEPSSPTPPSTDPRSIFSTSFQSLYQSLLLTPANSRNKDYYMLEEITDQVNLVAKIATTFFGHHTNAGIKQDPIQLDGLKLLRPEATYTLPIVNNGRIPATSSSSSSSPHPPSLPPLSFFHLENLQFVACGSSFYAALFGSYYLEAIAQVSSTTEVASEFVYRSPKIKAPYHYIPIPHPTALNTFTLQPQLESLTCFISQSGETSDTLQSLNYSLAHTPPGHLSPSLLPVWNRFKAMGIADLGIEVDPTTGQITMPQASSSSFSSTEPTPTPSPHCLPHTLSFVNVQQSSLARSSDLVLQLGAGVERAVASTKAFMAQSFWMLCLALYIAAEKDILFNNAINASVPASQQTQSPMLGFFAPTNGSLTTTNATSHRALQHELTTTLPYVLGEIYRQFFSSRVDIMSLFKEHDDNTNSHSTSHSTPPPIISPRGAINMSSYQLVHQWILLNTVKSIARAKNILILGRGPLYPIAMECSLKLKELTYVPTEGYASGEIKHGPLALVSDEVLVFALCPFDFHSSDGCNDKQDGMWFFRTFSNIQEVIARKGRVIVITDAVGFKHLQTLEVPKRALDGLDQTMVSGSNPNTTTTTPTQSPPQSTPQSPSSSSSNPEEKVPYFSFNNKNVFLLPALSSDPHQTATSAPPLLKSQSLSPISQPFAVMMTFQYIVYFSALYQKLDVDQPRNLAKCVAVE